MNVTRSTAAAIAVLLGASASFAATAHAESTPPDSAPPGGPASTVEFTGTASPEFCDSFFGVDTAFAQVPEDPAEAADYFTAEIEPLLPILTDNAPESIATEVGVMVAGATAAGAGDPSQLETPEMAAAEGVVYPALEVECGYQAVNVLATDFAFGGIPETLAPGRSVFVMLNESEGDEFHVMFLVHLNDDVDLSLEDILAMPEEEALQYAASLTSIEAAPGATGGVVVDLVPGRWIYLCPIPVGSVGGTEGTGPPHFVEGMAGEFIVE